MPAPFSITGPQVHVPVPSTGLNLTHGIGTQGMSQTIHDFWIHYLITLTMEKTSLFVFF